MGIFSAPRHKYLEEKRRVEECNHEILAALLCGEDSRGSSKTGLRRKSRQRGEPGVPVLLRGHKFY